jgi:hypothetical protein
MILQRAAPGVQHAEEPRLFRAHVLGIGRQDLQRLAGGLEHCGIGDALVGTNPVAQLGRQRERQQEVGTGQQPGGLFLEPCLGLVLLAGGAVPVAAGAAHGMGVPAGRTGIEDRAQPAGAAGGNGMDHFAVLGRHRLAEALEVVSAVPPQDVGDGGHGLLHEPADHGDHVLLALGGQMQMHRRGLQAAVAQTLLDQPQADSRFQQVGGVAVTQRMDRDLLLPTPTPAGTCGA